MIGNGSFSPGPHLSLTMLLQLIGVVALLFALLELIIIYIQTVSNTGHKSALVGLDAVEKGNTIKTSSSSTESVSYDLERRAIFLKVLRHICLANGLKRACQTNRVTEMDDGRT